MDKKHNNKNNLIQRIKHIKKLNNIDFNEFLVKYYPKNNQKENNTSILCIEREINIIKKIPKEIIPKNEEEQKHLYKNMKNKFEKEMKLISKFSHPNIMKIMHYFENPEYIYHIVLESYQCDLADFINQQISKKKYFQESLILSFFTQICLGIKYIHDLNILHRNINPSNILLISNKIVKLSNFDVYRILYTSNEKSITIVGNSYKDYISPEMGMEIPYSFKNDIWSLGILLFHMLALKVPFNLKQLSDIQSTKKVDPLYLSSKIPKHFSKDIKNLCIDLLKAYPAERPDINTILTKYRIIKNQINEIKKMFGDNIFVQNNIKNINNTELDHKNEEKNKITNNNYKTRFQSICTNYIKIGDNKIGSKKNINFPKKKEKKDEALRLSVYENIKEKIKDPHNIMERGYEQNYITGEIINIPDNGESIDFNNGRNNNNTNIIVNGDNNVNSNNGNTNMIVNGEYNINNKDKEILNEKI